MAGSKAQSISTFAILATLVNVYGAMKGNRDVAIPIVGGFIVSVILMGVAEAGADEIASLFAGAYFVTSLVTNGRPLIDVASQTVGVTTGMKAPPAASTQSTGSPFGTGTSGTPYGRPGTGAGGGGSGPKVA